MAFLITILGLLFGLIGSSYGGVQTQSRDTERQTDIQALQAQIEASYATNSYYPTLTNVNDASWRAQNMKGLDSEALKDPDGSSAKLTETPTKNAYSYKVTDDSGKSCNNTSVKCTKYALTATLSDGKLFTLNSF